MLKNNNNQRKKIVKVSEKSAIKTKTNMVVDYLIDLIVSKKVPVNKIMPSEHYVMEKMDCSRSIVVSAYQKLESIGAIYSISKRGHFVAENFHNLIKPIPFMLDVDRIFGNEVPSIKPNWFQEKNIIFVNGFRTFEKQLEKKGQIIGEAEIYISLKVVDLYEPLNLNKPLVASLNDRKALKNIVYELKYEKCSKLNDELLVVITFWGYDNDSVSIAGKYYIKPEFFKFYHQEFSLNH
ncbi:GntR family transcriptional regulator [Mycoplasmopsis felis]|uniref:GntR family transcriptional regulator n=1 Tax=Mycoplasmopsis felis TaxID=33923 RepID=UPI002AFE2DA4|nr:GntR family transcriptional regulator [Mycoplasmopsis felis]WQQ09086.1 GntR family transcriptional regulator [Mycoplasmopsis felis]